MEVATAAMGVTGVGMAVKGIENFRVINSPEIAQALFEYSLQFDSVSWRERSPRQDYLSMILRMFE